MKTMLLTLSCLAFSSVGWAQNEETKGHLVILPQIRQLTIQGLYGENKAVRAAGSPVLGVTYSHFATDEIHVGAWDESEKKLERLHLPSFGWFVDGLTGSRSGTRVRSVGFGGAVRLTSNPLRGEQNTLNRWYYGLGSGLYATQVEASRRSTGIGLGLRLFGGKDFADGSLIEVGYSYRPGTQGVHPSGLSVGIGRRF
jgi:hypothetical protein